MTDPQKTALITGASRGFGAALAEALAPTHHVIALARTVGALEELDDRIQATGGSATLVPLDAKDTDGISRLCASIHDRWGGLNLWVNTIVHAPPLSPVPHIAASDFSKSIAHGLTMTQTLIANIDPLLAATSGTAVHLDDPRAGQKFFGAYGAAKAGQKALFDSWAAEVESTDRTMISFEPRPMPTATRARFFPGENREALSSCAAEAARLCALLDL